MKVLVIDDNGVNLKAAQAQLKDHEVVVASTYDEGEKLVRQKGHGFDAVLVDLLMPPSTQQLRREAYSSEEMPVGIFLALLAAKNGAKYVAVLTDSDHHSHAASACLDAFNAAEAKPTPFKVGKASVMLSNRRGWVGGQFLKEDLSVKYETDWDLWTKDREAANQKEEELSERTKDWKALLDYLISYKKGVSK